MSSVSKSRSLTRRSLLAAIPATLAVHAVASPGPVPSFKDPTPRRDRYRAFVGRLPSGFTPADPGAVPETITEVRYLLSRRNARGLLRAVLGHNRRQLAARIPGRLWAVAIVRPQPSKGGAA